MAETELKFNVASEHALAVESALLRAGATTRRIESYQFDTVDGRLARAGLSLRLRLQDGDWEQTLKAPGRHAAVREEETVARPAGPGGAAPALDAALHRGSAAWKALRHALHHAPEGIGADRDGIDAGVDAGASTRTDTDARDGAKGEPALACVSSTLVSRLAMTTRHAEGRVEIAFDRGEVVAGGSSEPILEVEYELLDGSPRALVALGRAGVVEHGMWLATTAKSARGARLSGIGEAPAPVKARPPVLKASMDGTALLRAVLGACLEQVLANLDPVAAGEGSDEHVHQLRVGLRRLRTAGRELGALNGGARPAWEAGLASAFRELGAVRDRTSVAARLQRQFEEAGSPSPGLVAADGTGAALREPAQAVRDPAFQCALLDAIGDSLTPAERQGASADEARRLVAHRLTRLRTQLHRSARRFDDFDDAARHRARKRLKRLRYLAELAGPLWKRAPVQAFLTRLGPAQDALGDYMDLVVGLQMARAAVVEHDPASWFNIGWLTAALPKAERRCRRTLAAAAKAKPFWL